MANVYKVTINSIEPAANGQVNADAFIQIRTATNPVTWGDVINGHRTIVIEARDVLAIWADPSNSTNVLKRQALTALIKVKALEFGIDTADEAYGNMLSVLTLPYDVTIRGT